MVFGDGQGGFVAGKKFRAGRNPFALVTGDFNTDGRTDLAVANATSGDLSIFIGDGAGGVGPATNFPVGSYPRGIALGGFREAGKLDFAVANSGSNSVAILSNAVGNAAYFGNVSSKPNHRDRDATSVRYWSTR